jgi:hypothetical protein
LAPSRPGPFPWPGSAARRTCCRAGYPWSRARAPLTKTLRHMWPVLRPWARRSPRIRTLRMRSSPFSGIRPEEGAEPDPPRKCIPGCPLRLHSCRRWRRWLRRPRALPGRPPGRALPGSDHLRMTGRPACRATQPAAAPPGPLPDHDRGGFFAPNCAPSAEKQGGRRYAVGPRSPEH